MKQEIWMPIAGYEGLYEISNFGRVKSMPKKWEAANGCVREKGETILYLNNNGRGYLQVKLSKNGSNKTINVHKLVAFSFVPNIEGKPQVNHKNGIKRDNHFENLEWVTNKENQRHSFSVLKRVPSSKGHCNNHPLREKIVCTNLNKEYNSIREAARELNMCRNVIKRSLKNQPQRHPLKFSYA